MPVVRVAAVSPDSVRVACACSIGRRPAFFIYLFIECFFGIATAFAQDFLTWSAFRFGVGFTVPAILGTPYVLGKSPHSWRLRQLIPRVPT
jgi:predicted MFS family arabinose efflux permease